MKTTIKLLRFLAICGSVACYAACTATTTTVTAPDGTVTITKTFGPATGAIAAGAAVAAEILDQK